MKRRIPQRLLYVLAPALMLLVACTQRVLVHTQDLTAWKGGGFGMFSTFDSPGARTLRLLVLTPEGEAIVAFPELNVLKERLLNFPNDGVLRELAEQAAAEKWVLYPHDTILEMKRDLPEEFRRQLSRAESARQNALAEDSTAVLPDPHPDYLAFTATKRPISYQGIEADVIGVRAEVWRLVFDADTRTFSGELINSVTVEVP